MAMVTLFTFKRRKKCKLQFSQENGIEHTLVHALINKSKSWKYLKLHVIKEKGVWCYKNLNIKIPYRETFK